MTQLGIALDAGAAPVFTYTPKGPATQVAGLLKRGGRIVGMTMGQFSLLDLLVGILDVTGPADVRLSTWTMGIRDARNAGVMLDEGRMRSFQLLVDRSFASRQPAYCAAVTRTFGRDAIRCTRTHAKIALISTACGWRVTVRSSMNLNTNPRFEQFDIDDSPEIHAFYTAHFDEMATEMPAGAFVATSEVDAVFERLRRGVNPFAVPTRDAMRAAGIPAGDAPALVAFIEGRLAENRKARTKPTFMRELGKPLGMKPADFLAAVRVGTLSALEDAALHVASDAPSAFGRDEG